MDTLSDIGEMIYRLQGRTGTLICCLFLHLNEFENAEEALKFFGLMRTIDGKVHEFF
jgi:hypothetical protein